MKRSTSVGTLGAAAAAGIALGVAGFLLFPFEPGRDAVAGPGPSPANSAPSAGPEPPASPSPSRPSEPAPPFTRDALLRPAEFVRYGWGRAERGTVHEGAPEEPGLHCLPAAATEGARERYAAGYQGLQTEAAEVVARYPDTATAERAFERLSRQVEECESAEGARRAATGDPYEPRFAGVDRVRWWNTEVNREGADGPPPMRGVIGLARVQDRLVALSLTSASSDPVTTVEWEPLLGQAARRLV